MTETTQMILSPLRCDQMIKKLCDDMAGASDDGGQRLQTGDQKERERERAHLCLQGCQHDEQLGGVPVRPHQAGAGTLRGPADARCLFRAVRRRYAVHHCKCLWLPHPCSSLPSTSARQLDRRKEQIQACRPGHACPRAHAHVQCSGRSCSSHSCCQCCMLCCTLHDVVMECKPAKEASCVEDLKPAYTMRNLNTPLARPILRRQTA